VAFGIAPDDCGTRQVDPSGFRHAGGSGAVLVFSVRPTKVFAFAKGTFGQTRYLF
jgi:hypothetical protein